MNLLRISIAAFKYFFRREQRSLEMDEELRTYLEASTQEKMRSGMSQPAAMRAARAEMGSMEAVKHKVRSSNWESIVEALWRDVCFGARRLLKSPGFTAVAAITLALGIGANTAVFTLVHAVMLKELPIDHPRQLYRIGDGETYCCEWGGLQESWGTFDYPFYQHLRDTDSSFSQIAAFSGQNPSINIRRANSSGAAQTTDGEYVSGNYFSTLGIQASAGRLFNSADDLPSSTPVAVMGYRTWQQRFASDPSIVGSVFLMNELPVTVVGIAPPGFFGDRLSADPPELWLPLAQEPAFEGQGKKSLLYSSGMAWLYLFGRVKPGVAIPAAQAQLTTELQQWLRTERTWDSSNIADLGKQHILITPGGRGVSTLRSGSKNGLYLLSAASILVLLIACANLANLLLARAVSQRQQTALRLSLGASRFQLICSVLTESVLLSLLGGAAGLVFAYAGAKAILLIVFRGATLIPVDASPSLPILGFAFVLSVFTAVVFTVVPAWIGTGADPAEGLRSGSRSATGRESRPQKALIVIQAALSVVLLAIAGLVTQSLRNLEKTNFGFQPQGRLVAALSFKAAGYTPERLPALYQQIEERLEQIPGVRSASMSLNAPREFCCVNLGILIGGRSEKWIDDVDVIFSRVTSHYFQTIGTPLLRGRAFDQRDTQSAPHVAIVDDAFARTFFAGQDPIGKHFGLSLPGHGFDYEIVGVAGNAAYSNPASERHPMFFVPYTQVTQYEPAGYQRLETGTLYAQLIEVSVSGAPETYQNSVRKALAEIDPNLSLLNIRTYSEQVAIQFNQERLIARLTGLFSILALVLATIGLYGVTAYNVAQRTAEIGIRMALGADKRKVVGMVIKGAFLNTFAGLCVGVPLAIVCCRYLAHQLYAVAAFNPAVLAGTIVILSVCALLAALIPARRAASVDPNSALRIE